MTFLYLGSLLGLLAVSIPILIHLLNKFRVKRVHWAAMRFLMESIQRNQRRVKMEDLIMLLVRCLIVILLTLAFARPVFFHSDGNVSSGTVNAVIIIDDSMSMSYSSNGKSNFDHAREAALKILDDLGGNSQVALYFVSDRVKELVSPPTHDLNVIRRALQSAEVSSRSSDLWPGIKSAVNELLNLDGPGKLFVITDGQELAWRHRQEIIDLLAEEQAKISFQVVSVGDTVEPNMCVSSLRLDSSIPVVNESLRSVISVTNWSPTAASGVKVTLSVDHSAPSAETTLSAIGPGQTVTVNLITHIAEPGFHSLTAAIPADHLTVDDRRSVAFEVLKDLHVLVVEGGSSTAKPEDGDGFYLANALLPVPATQQSQYYLKVKLGQPSDLEHPLDAYRAVFLSNVAQLNPQAVDALAAFVKQGGGLVIFPGEKTSTEFYNTNPAMVSMLPALIGKPENITEHKVLSLQSRGFTHPLTAIWNDVQNGDLGSVHVNRYCPLSLVVPSDQAKKSGQIPEVVANYANGKPAIVTQQFGKGHVILFSMPATPAWGNLPINPNFLPLVYRLVGYMVKQTGSETVLDPGMIFADSLGTDMADKDFFVHQPGDAMEKRSTGRMELEHDHALLRFSDTEAPGPYEVYIGDANKPEITFAVQTKPEESNLNRVPDDYITAALKLNASSGKTDSATATAARLRVTSELWLTVFSIALAAVLLEMVLAYLFARRSR